MKQVKPERKISRDICPIRSDRPSWRGSDTYRHFIGGSDHADDQQQCPIHRLHPLFIETAKWFADFCTR